MPGRAAVGDAMDPRIRQGIFAGESGGDYDALFKYSNRPGGQFAGKNVTGMTINEALQFANPRGPYAQWVAANNKGTVASPMGAYQIVGRTLKAARDWAGLTGNERMDQATQDRLADAILANQGTGAWSGYRGPRDVLPPSAGAGIDEAKRDTPSNMSPVGSQLPGPSSQFTLPNAASPGFSPTTSTAEGEPKKKSKWGALSAFKDMGAPPVPNAVTFDQQQPKAAVVRGEPMAMVNPEQQAQQRQMLAQLLAMLNQSGGLGGGQGM